MWGQISSCLLIHIRHRQAGFASGDLYNLDLYSLSSAKQIGWIIDSCSLLYLGNMNEA
jgi:hypothetical protein